MNITIRGRLWQILIRREALPSFRSGVWPRPTYFAAFRWWHVGYWEIRRYYHGGEYGYVA